MAERFPPFVLRVLRVSLFTVLALSLQLRADRPDPALSLPDANFALLRELLDKALAQSPQMMQRSIALSRAEGDRIAGDSRLLPTVYASGRLSYDNISLSGSRSTNGTGAYYSLGINQPLYHWGEYSAEREIGRLSERIAQKAYGEAYRDLAANVRAQFLRLIIIKRSLALRAHEVASRERSLREQSARLEAGVGSKSEQGIAQILFDESSHNLERERFEYEQSRQALARLCGIGSLGDEQVPAELPAPVLAANQALELVSFFDQTEGFKALPSVVSTQHSLRQSELRYHIASVRLLPKVDFNASTSLDNQTFLSNTSLSQDATRRHTVGLVANWTLFDGLATRASKRQALADKRDAELRLQNILQGLDDQKRASVRRFELAVRGQRLAEERHERQRAAYNEARENASQGRISPNVVDEFMTGMLTTEVQVLTARTEVYSRWNDLVSLLWLDPALQRLPAHYLNHGN